MPQTAKPVQLNPETVEAFGAYVRDAEAVEAMQQTSVADKPVGTTGNGGIKTPARVTK